MTNQLDEKEARAQQERYDENFSRNFIEKNSGEIIVDGKYVEASFPKNLNESTGLSGEVFRAGNWHNLRVLMTKQGRLDVVK